MHELNIRFDTDNDAFQDGNKKDEAIRILLDCIKHLQLSDEDKELKDVNGNCVGGLWWR